MSISLHAAMLMGILASSLPRPTMTTLPPATHARMPVCGRSRSAPTRAAVSHTDGLNSTGAAWVPHLAEPWDGPGCSLAAAYMVWMAAAGQLLRSERAGSARAANTNHPAGSAGCSLLLCGCRARAAEHSAAQGRPG